MEPRRSEPAAIGPSGSSAGPGSATAAGLVAFGIGTETRGSIISPSSANGVIGLRPTYGRVSRYGAMALSWTMDKIGPMCRSVEDCALVFNASTAPTAATRPWSTRPSPGPTLKPLAKLRIGYVEAEFNPKPEAAKRRTRRGRGGEGGQVRRPDASATPGRRSSRMCSTSTARPGASVEAVELPASITNIASVISFVLSTEGAAAFDDLTRSTDINDPSLNTWPNAFRTHRFVPAVEYIRAQRRARC